MLKPTKLLLAAALAMGTMSAQAQIKLAENHKPKAAIVLAGDNPVNRKAAWFFMDEVVVE